MSNVISEMPTRTSVRSMSLLTATGYTVGEYIKGLANCLDGNYPRD